MDLTTLLGEAAARHSGKTALIGERSAMSYAEFNLKAQAVAHDLLAFGAEPGSRIALHMRNGTAIAVCYFACFSAGMIAVPINTRMKAPEIDYVLEHSGASIYIGEDQLFREINGVSSRLSRMRLLVVDADNLPGACASAAPLPTILSEQPAAILYTSGSTAHPKGVVHTHFSLMHAAQDFGVDEHDVVTLITPMVHSAAFMTLIAAIQARATAVAVTAFEPNAVLDAIEQHRGTYLLGMPAMYSALISAQQIRPRDLGSVSRFLAGGDSVPLELQREFQDCMGQPIHEIFGTTENGWIAANFSSAPCHQGSFGRPPPSVEVAVVDADGALLPAGSAGEMIVRSSATMIGYWNDPKETERALKGGWFHTGDLVRQTRDGYLWFVGRQREIIVTGGSNVSPQEVEAVLYRHPDVREAGVVGMLDRTRGERVVAFVSRPPGSSVKPSQLISFVASQLAAYKTPEEIVFLDDLPKSVAGKLQRRALRERYGTGLG
jgi:acyl-CoA synthetase (AMP-forming)/AMP-acid ligase II